MAHTGQTVDVALLPQDQQAPATGSPPGRVKRITNGVATKYERDGRQALRIEKRFGFRRLDDDIRTPATGGDLSDVFGTPDLLATFRDQLISIDTDHVPSVRASTAEKWEKFTDETVLTRTLSQRVVFTGPAQASMPDGATVGGVHCYVWREGTTAYLTIVDDDGTPLRTKAVVTDPCLRIKVVSDGTNFYVFTESDAHVIRVAVYSGATGQGIDSLTIDAGPDSGDFNQWDVTSTGFGVLWVGLSELSGPQMHRLGLSGSSITITTVSLAGVAFNQGIAFLLNDAGDEATRAYFVGVDQSEGGSPQFFGVFTVGAAGLVNSASLIGPDGDPDDDPCYINAAGYVVSTGGSARQAVVFATEMFDESLQLDNITRVMVQTLGSGSAATEVQEIRKVGVASRAFRIGGNYYCAVYYSSVPTFEASFGTQLGQPSYFLLRMSTTAARVVGRFDYGKASMGWPEDGTDLGLGLEGRWHLGSPFVDTVAGHTHLPLGYSSSQQMVNLENQGGQGIGLVRAFATSVGVKDTVIGRPGQALECSGELLLPGAMAVSFTGGDFSEQGVNLAPEQAISVTSTNNASGFLVVGAEYEYVWVFEWTLPNGDRARSQVSTPRSVTIASGHEAATIVGHSLTMTGRRDVVISGYRTVWDVASGTPSTIHYKVTDDLAPLFNDPTDDTWTFVDLMSDAEAVLQEPLYTDQIDAATGARPLQHDPCPAFSCGAIIDNRAIVAGYDGYLWVSGEKTPGEALWWNEDTLRIAMPTSDPVRGIVHLDSRIVIFCARSIWWIPRGVFPDGRGLGGALRAPERLPFENGSAGGFIASVRGGIVYDHSAGGVWLLSRDLNNVDVGSPAADDLDGATISGITADQNGRVMVGVAVTDHGAGSLMVFDTLAGTWYRWSWAGGVEKVAIWRGEVVASTGSVIWLYAPGQYVDGVAGNDDESAPIITTLEIDYVHLNKVRDFKRVWNIQLLGEYLGDHDLAVTVCRDDDPERTTVTTYEFTPDEDEPYHYELPPDDELCASLGFTITDSFPRTMGNASFAIELLSFYVALEKGLVQPPPSVRRIVPQPGVPVDTGGGVSSGSSAGGVVVTLDGVNTGTSKLSTYNATNLRSGSFAYVRSLRAHYWLDRDTDGGADGLFRVAAVGGGWWTRIVRPDPYWQDLYAGGAAYLDLSGVSALQSDENSGDDETAPLYTGRELWARLDGARLDGLQVNVVSGIVGPTDAIEIPPSITGVICLHGTASVITSGTLTASTPASGNARATVTDTGRANWTGLVSSVLATRWIRKTGGGVRAAMHADRGSGVAWIGPSTDAPETGPLSFVPGPAAVNFGSTDAYQIYGVPKLPLPKAGADLLVEAFSIDFTGGALYCPGGFLPVGCGFLGVLYVPATTHTLAVNCYFAGGIHADGVLVSSFCFFAGSALVSKAAQFGLSSDGTALVNHFAPASGQIGLHFTTASAVAVGIVHAWGATAALLKGSAGATVHVSGLRGEDNTGRLVDANRSIVYGGGGITATTSSSNKYDLNGSATSSPPGADNTNGGAIYA